MRQCRHGVARLGALVAWVLLGSTWVLASAQAEVRVYHSPLDDGAPAPTAPTLAGVGVETLFLYVDLVGDEASGQGVACEDGDGQELCGWDLRLRASPGVEVVDFAASAGIVAKLEGRALRVNGLHARSPALSPVRMGRLRVRRATADGGTVAVRGVAVTANLEVEELVSTTVAVVPVPEAAMLWAQATAVASALGLVRWRVRSGRQKAIPRPGSVDGNTIGL